jgi:hypothetical protein
MPCRGQGAGLGFAVADDAGDDQVRIVERGPKGMADRITQLAPLMNRPWRLRRNIGWFRYPVLGMRSYEFPQITTSAV